MIRVQFALLIPRFQRAAIRRFLCRSPPRFPRHWTARLMNPVVIENPILNAPFEMPHRHFKFNDDGITDEIEERRRPSSYFVRIANGPRR